MTEKQYISVTELNLSVKACIDFANLKNLEIFGEVSGWKVSKGAAYFSLKDKQSCLSCVCFSCSKTYSPKDGESVILRGSVDYYVPGGKLSFKAVEIKPYGMGLLALEFELTKKKLEAEGLFLPEFKKPIPRFCKNVLVLTSATGAVLRDIMTTVRRKNSYLNLVVKDVRVQGKGASIEIANALRAVDRLNYDAVILARGGGSLEDLAPFYDEDLARTIFNMRTPIISAIGHETDFSLCDFVADVRAATPTAAAEIVAFDSKKLVRDIQKSVINMHNLCAAIYKKNTSAVRFWGIKLQGLAEKFYSNKRYRLINVNSKMVSSSKRLLEKKYLKYLSASQRHISSYRRLVDLKANKTALLSRKNVQEISKVISKNEFRFVNLARILDNLSPLKTMQRGYFAVEKEGKRVVGVNGIDIGDTVETKGFDGSFKSVINEINKTEAE